MFDLREFIKKGLVDAVGKMADYQVILNATGWYEKGVLFQEDLAELDTAIETHRMLKEAEKEKLFNGVIEESDIPRETPETM